MNAKHTPGPWFKGGRLHVYDVGMGCEIACTGVSAILSEDAMEANAHLIALTPKLLEACRAAQKLGTLGEEKTTAEVRAMLDEVLAEVDGQ